MSMCDVILDYVRVYFSDIFIGSDVVEFFEVGVVVV